MLRQHGHGGRSRQGRTAGEAAGQAGAGGAQGRGGSAPTGDGKCKGREVVTGARAGTQCLQGGEGTGACAGGRGRGQ